MFCCAPFVLSFKQGLGGWYAGIDSGGGAQGRVDAEREGRSL